MTDAPADDVGKTTLLQRTLLGAQDLRRYTAELKFDAEERRSIVRAVEAIAWTARDEHHEGFKTDLARIKFYHYEVTSREGVAPIICLDDVRKVTESRRSQQRVRARFPSYFSTANVKLLKEFVRRFEAAHA